ncbi:MAG TPA: PAS domain S-box protein [Acidimicrobiales bacterium]|nr:PAS domain S-box protein [Acidimicrobiales bacterium]
MYEALLEAAPDAIVGVTSAGRIVVANSQAERLFGYDRADIIGQPIELLVPESVRPVHPTHRAGYVQDPKPRPMGAGLELAGRRKDGTEFPAEISLSSVMTDDGLIVAAAIRDVADRISAEAKFRGLLEAAPDAIVGVDSQGLIALVNSQAERLFGYERSEMIGQKVELLVPEAKRSVHPERRSRYVNDPLPRPMGAGMELAGRRKNGSEFPAEISLSAIETADGLLVSAAVRDVSERIEAQAERERLRAEAQRERLEGQLHQSQRLESLGQLAGGVAHDFNNLLGAILNYAAFVVEEVEKLPDGLAPVETLRNDAQQIRRAAERGAELTHQLLAFGRREVVQPQVLDLNRVVRGVEQLLRRTLGEHVELLADLAAEVSPVLADPGQLEQVLVNLAVNARDAMGSGGALTIDTGDVDVDEAFAAANIDLVPGRYVRLRVSDDGAGMSAEVVEHAFEPFYTTKPKGEGSGLGLATVYGIVTQAGGHAHIYSEVGVGTTFSALFPATDQPAPESASSGGPKQHHGGETVLVVEDEAAMREVTRRILDRNGYKVLVAVNGAEALDLSANFDAPIHLLLTDVIMPQMLGKDVAEAITATRPATRVLYMSGYAQPVLASQGTLDAGVTLLEKPFSEAGLLEKLREVLDAGAL